MEYFTYIIKIAIYILIALTFYALGGQRGHVITFGNASGTLQRRNVPKLGWDITLLLSALLGWYATICSTLPHTADRRNYSIRFTSGWANPWRGGLNYVANFLHLFTNEPNALFFTISFLCTFFFLLAYRISKQGKREALLLLAASNCLVDSFALLKQAPAVALTAVSIVLLLQKKYSASLLFLAGAILFHESAFILIPLYGILLTARKSWLRYLCYFAMAICVVFFSGVSRLAFSFIGAYMPRLMKESMGYLDNTGAMAESKNVLTVFKGLPYYWITVYGFANRKRLKDRIENYDKFLMMGAFTCAMRMLSVYMYWMFRFGMYCDFLLFLFSSELYRIDERRRQAQEFLLLLIAMLASLELRYLNQIYFLYGGF